jgi:hypothetical protein
MKINELNDDILDIIYKEINIKCHTCNINFNFNTIFYKKISSHYFCSKDCYDFI